MLYLSAMTLKYFPCCAAAHLQLLGEASIDVGLVPPASLRPERSHDPQDLAEMIGGDGDINDDVIYDIVAQV